MSEAPTEPGPAGAHHRALLRLSKAAAIGGGIVFVALAAMSVVSIVGRKLFSWSVPGDVELLQMCAAFAASSFFAYCHLTQSDVKVDFFTQHLAPRTVARLDAMGSLFVAVFGALLAWRTGAGALGLKEAHETSAILGWPVWVAEGLMVPGFALLAAAGLSMCVLRLREPGRFAVAQHVAREP